MWRSEAARQRCVVRTPFAGGCGPPPRCVLSGCGIGTVSPARTVVGGHSPVRAPQGGGDLSLPCARPRFTLAHETEPILRGHLGDHLGPSACRCQRSADGRRAPVLSRGEARGVTKANRGSDIGCSSSTWTPGASVAPTHPGKEARVALLARVRAFHRYAHATQVTRRDSLRRPSGGSGSRESAVCGRGFRCA